MTGCWQGPTRHGVAQSAVLHFCLIITALLAVKMKMNKPRKKKKKKKRKKKKKKEQNNKQRHIVITK